MAFCLKSYFTKSEISKKLNGFVIKYEEASPSVVPSTSSATEFDGLQSGAREESEYVSKHVSALRMVEGFLSALQNATRDGRIVSHPFLSLFSMPLQKHFSYA